MISVNYEEFKEYLKTNFDNWKRKIKESIEFHSDFDKLLERVPTTQDLENYYYDFTKNTWVPKNQMGEPIERIDTNIGQLISIEDNKYIGETYELELPDNSPLQEINSNLPVFSKYVNTIILNIEFVDYTGQDDIRLFYYIYTPSQLTTGFPCEVMEDWVLRENTKRAIQICHFTPQKDFQIGFINHGTRKIKVKYTFLYEEQTREDIYLYSCRLNNETLGFSVMNPIHKFNRITIMLDIGPVGTLNFDIDISAGFGRDFVQSIKIIDETISTGTEYYKTYELPATSNVVMYMKNNQAVDTDFHILLFFSNSKMIEEETTPIGVSYSYNTTVLTGTLQVLPLNSQLLETNSNIIDVDTANNRIIVKETGYYYISYLCRIENTTTTRSTAFSQASPISGCFAYSYHRDTSCGEITGQMSGIFYITANTNIQVQARRQAGTGTLQANCQFLYVMKINNKIVL